MPGETVTFTVELFEPAAIMKGYVLLCVRVLLHWVPRGFKSVINYIV